MRFFVCVSIVLCTPLYLILSVSLASSITLGLAPVSCCVVEFDFCSFFGICGLVFPFSLIETSSSDHLCKSCMISADNGGLVGFFLSKHACFTFSQLKLLGELLAATFDRGVFGFRPMCASNGENFVTPCGVILNVFIFSATSEARRYGVFVLSILIIASLRLSVFIILSTTPIALWSSTGAKNNFMLLLLQKNEIPLLLMFLPDHILVFAEPHC